MKLTTVICIDQRFNPVLDALCQISNNLYNQYLYLKRQNFLNHSGSEKSDQSIQFSTPHFTFKYPEVYAAVKKLNNYQQLPASVAQNTCLAADQDMKSFFGSLNAKKSGTVSNQIRLPRYKHKNDKFALYFNQGNFRQKGREIVFTTPKKLEWKNSALETLTFKQTEKITLILPPKFENIPVKYIEIVPYLGIYRAHIVYDTTPVNLGLDHERFMGIDIGLNNLASSLLHTGEAVLWSGKKIKSSNEFFNKAISKLSSRIDKSKSPQEIKSLKNQRHKLLRKRNGFLSSALHSTAKKIIDSAVENNIGTIVIGKNDGWKQNINIGKDNNRKFMDVPHAKFIEILQYLSVLRNIKCVTVEESYTSKCDVLALEPMQRKDYLGKRKHRGLFISSTKQALNADINGAANILRKTIAGESVLQILGNGRFQRPEVRFGF